MATTNPSLNALLVSISNLLKLGGVALASKGLISPGIASDLEIWSGVILVVGPLVWDVWNAIQGLRKGKAVGVQAGINLTASGQAVDSQGAPISRFAADATPPKPVTLESAAEIVKTYGPAPADIGKA